jgi:hypothetical protein
MHHCGVQIAEHSIAKCGLMIADWNPKSAVRNPQYKGTLWQRF